MAFRYILILFSVLGISATFMPWLHYPKNDVIFYGYLADGILTGCFFMTCLIYLLVTRKKEHQNKILISMMGIFGFILAYGAYNKIVNINLEKLTFTSNDPLVIAMSAGFHEGIGIYVFGMSGLAMGITVILSLIHDILSKKVVGYQVASAKVKPYTIWAIVILITGSLTWIAINHFSKSTPKEEELRSSISASIDSMASAFINENYDQFVAYTHPTMLQSIGGVEKTVQLLRSTNESLKEQETRVSKIAFSDMYDIKNDGKTIQALVAQKITFKKGDESREELQKMIAISEDKGKSWKYINIGDNTKVEMTKLFPLINPNLKF